MREFELTTRITEWDNEDELTADSRELLAAARSILGKAYAPYSGFHVAAAIRLDNGEIISGTNQENAAYPSGLCAERVALFTASSRFPERTITEIAVLASSKLFSVDHPVAPCGACRQVMLEYRLRQGGPVKVILQGAKGKVYTLSDIQGLLPLFFHEEGLKKG